MHCWENLYVFSNWAVSVLPTASQLLSLLLLIYLVWPLIIVSSNLPWGPFSLLWLGSLACLGCFQTPELYLSFLHYLEKRELCWMMLHFSFGRSPSGCTSRLQRFLNKIEFRYICTVSEEEKLCVSFHASPKSSDFQPLSASGKYVKPKLFPSKSGWTAPADTSKTACPVQLLQYLSLDCSLTFLSRLVLILESRRDLSWERRVLGANSPSYRIPFNIVDFFVASYCNISVAIY